MSTNSPVPTPAQILQSFADKLQGATMEVLALIIGVVLAIVTVFLIVTGAPLAATALTTITSIAGVVFGFYFGQKSSTQATAT